MGQEREDGMIRVLDKGFVACEGVFGDERTVVNCARVSFGKQKEVVDESDIRLLRYLIRNRHMSPFRHVMFRFHIRAPEMVMRQWYKHIVGAEWAASSTPPPLHAWNEISGRYVALEDVYMPGGWRRQSTDCKQGSDGELESTEREECAALYKDTVNHCLETYKQLLERGVAREEARLVLPLSLYTETIWTCSFQAVMNFLTLRLDSHAQMEIREYARAIYKLVTDATPILVQCWEEAT